MDDGLDRQDETRVAFPGRATDLQVFHLEHITAPDTQPTPVGAHTSAPTRKTCAATAVRERSPAHRKI